MLRVIAFLLALLVIYTLVKGCATGTISTETTIGEVMNDVQYEGETIVDNTVGPVVENAVSDLQGAVQDIAHELRR